MKAWFLVGARELECRDAPEPSVAPDGVVIQVRACGVCGSDVRRWRAGPASDEDVVIPGHEAAGCVVRVGKDVQGIAVGDRLALAPDVHCGRCFYCKRGMYNLCDDLRLVGISPGYPGGCSERMAIPGEVLANGIVHKMPSGLSYEAGALAEPLSSVLACQEMIAASLGDTVVVIGAGPIGCLHVAITKARGARVLVSQRSPARRELVRRFRPDAIIDPQAEEGVSAVRRLTDGLGADAVICANPVGETQTQAVRMVRKGGTVALFGGLPRANPMVSMDANRIHYGEIRVVGSFSYHPRMHELALDVLARGLVDAEQVVTHALPFDETPDAFETASRGDALKVMVTQRGD